jgi:DNA-binding response OmpR family regulator
VETNLSSGLAAMSTKTVRVLLYMTTETRDGLQEILESIEDNHTRYSVDSLSAYDDAISAMVNNTHDLYIVDHLLPNTSVSGLELVERVNAGGCNRPVILVTSMSDEDVEWAAEEAGAACFLNRPLDMEPRVLKHAIRFSLSHFSRLKDVQYKLVLMKTQLSEICRKLNRG